MRAVAGGRGYPAAMGHSKAWMLLTRCFWTWLKAAGLMDTMQGALGCLPSIHGEFGPPTARATQQQLISPLMLWILLQPCFLLKWAPGFIVNAGFPIPSQLFVGTNKQIWFLLFN